MASIGAIDTQGIQAFAQDWKEYDGSGASRTVMWKKHGRTLKAMGRELQKLLERELEPVRSAFGKDEVSSSGVRGETRQGSKSPGSAVFLLQVQRWLTHADWTTVSHRTGTLLEVRAVLAPQYEATAPERARASSATTGTVSLVIGLRKNEEVPPEVKEASAIFRSGLKDKARCRFVLDNIQEFVEDEAFVAWHDKRYIVSIPLHEFGPDDLLDPEGWLSGVAEGARRAFELGARYTTERRTSFEKLLRLLGWTQNGEANAMAVPVPDPATVGGPLPYPVEEILRALDAKPFVLLPGVSGTGKTQLARRLAGWAAQLGGVRRLRAALINADGPEGGTPPIRGDRDAGGIHGILPPPRNTSSASQVAFLPVRPDWTEAAPFWGHYNPLTRLYYPTDATRVVLDAWRRFAGRDCWSKRDGPTHFLVLDEMNLARVEYYLSDLLSLMESGARREGRRRYCGELARIHDHQEALPTSMAFKEIAPPTWPETHREVLVEGRRNHATAEATTEAEGLGTAWVPPFVPFPPNLAIIGTVNVDETTHAFSPKVLDRAFVFEFLDIGVPGENGGPASTAAGDESIEDFCVGLNGILRPARLHFGYRTMDEMQRYVAGPQDGATAKRLHAADADVVLCSKVLPKLRGTEDEIGDVIAHLLAVCFAFPSSTGRNASPAGWEERARQLDRWDTSHAFNAWKEAVAEAGGTSVAGAQGPPLPRSAAKLLDMWLRLRATGFTAYF